VTLLALGIADMATARNEAGAQSFICSHLQHTFQRGPSEGRTAGVALALRKGGLEAGRQAGVAFRLPLHLLRAPTVILRIIVANIPLPWL